MQAAKSPCSRIRGWRRGRISRSRWTYINTTKVRLYEKSVRAARGAIEKNFLATRIRQQGQYAAARSGCCCRRCRRAAPCAQCGAQLASVRRLPHHPLVGLAHFAREPPPALLLLLLLAASRRQCR
jgi:hypothetical protein